MKQKKKLAAGIAIALLVLSGCGWSPGQILHRPGHTDGTARAY